MKKFKDILAEYDWNRVGGMIYDSTVQDVESALNSTQMTMKNFAALLSPTADKYLMEMANRSHETTLKRFGKTIQMYIPLYLSNECQNICTYCGFSYNNKIERKTLNDAEILKEVEAIKKFGFDHVLLVTGEAQQTVNVEYFKHVINLIKPHFSQISIEVQPLLEQEYKELAEMGLHTVLVYQETYNRDKYKTYHPKGKKSNFDYRLDTPERIGSAGIHKIGLGVLLGLEDWRIDSFYTALHLEFLRKKYWKTKFSISFPRLRPFSGGFMPNMELTDRNLIQLITAYRLFDENIEISLSTREDAEFREKLIPLGITSISAGSKTEPGGYACNTQALEQFEISDERTPAEVVKAVKKLDYDIVWKDWDMAYN